MNKFIHVLTILLILILPAKAEDLDQGIAQKIIKSTVRIRATSPRKTHGTGFIVHTRITEDPRVRSTLILTNRHVVEHGKTFEVDKFIYLKNRMTVATTAYHATVAYVSSDQDVALVKIETPAEIEFTPVTISTEEDWDKNMSLYSRVYLVACGQGIEPHVTNGNISSVNHTEDEMEFTAAIIFGSSGGGIYNSKGELIGICRAIRVANYRGPHPVPHLAIGVPLPGLLQAFRGTDYAYALGLEAEEEENEDNDWEEEWQDWEKWFEKDEDEDKEWF